ncbi:MAG: hypothetical protein K0S71_2957 [Clostridia bacterium]|jgi:hypothetical protein|nr:hypothetical protein [Clostridia bacterium]
MVSPAVLLFILGGVFIIVQMINGIELVAAMNSFRAFVYSLMPYFKYLTTIPIALFLIPILLKNWHKIKKAISKS